MKARITIILMSIALLVWIGISAGRWAAKQSRICEQSYQQAIDILRDK